MTALLLLSLAHADPATSSPLLDRLPVAVDAVVWAQPFTLDVPERWTMTRQEHELSRGWLVEVRAPAELLQARAVGQPVLFADTTAALPLHPPLVASCAVVVVPVATDREVRRWYFGSPLLPERLDAARADEELQAAIDAGVPPMAPQTMAPPARYHDLREVARVAEARFQACRGAPPEQDP